MTPLPALGLRTNARNCVGEPMTDDQELEIMLEIAEARALIVQMRGTAYFLVKYANYGNDAAAKLEALKVTQEAITAADAWLQANP